MVCKVFHSSDNQSSLSSLQSLCSSKLPSSSPSCLLFSPPLWSIERSSLVQLLCPPKQSQLTTIPNSQFTITTQHITNHHLQSSQFTQATIKSITLFKIQHPDYHHHCLKSCPMLLAAAGLTAQRTQTKAQPSGRNTRTQQSPPTPQLHLFLKSAAHELQQSPLNPILASPALSSHHHHHQPRSTTS